MFGWKRDEILGKDIGTIMNDSMAMYHRKYIDNYIAVCMALPRYLDTISA
jgi:hypothetical protein